MKIKIKQLLNDIQRNVDYAYDKGYQKAKEQFYLEKQPEAVNKLIKQALDKQKKEFLKMIEKAKSKVPKGSQAEAVLDVLEQQLLGGEK